MKIPFFHGTKRFEEVLNWFYEVESLFDIMEVLEKEKMKLISGH